MIEERPAYLSPELRARIALEKKKCAADPEYYIFNHVRTIDPLDSERPVKKFPDLLYLRYLVRHVLHGGNAIEYIIKSRQIMMSWVCVAYISWLCRFHPYVYCYIQSKKDDDARAMLYDRDPKKGRLNLIERNLPWWLKDQFVMDRVTMKWMTGEVNFASKSGSYPNGAVVTALAQGPSQVEGHVPRFFFGDEASLQALWAAAMGAVKPTIQKDAKLVCVGTSRPPSEFNLEMECTNEVDDQGINIPTRDAWEEIHKGIYKYTSKSGISAHGIHYTADPNKDPANPIGDAWVERMSSVYDGGMQSTAWQQHMEIDFAAVGGTLLIPFFRSHKQYLVCRPIPRNHQLGWKYYAGFDYGKRNLTVFGVYAVTPEGRRYMVDEIAAPGSELGGVPGICERMKESPYWEDVRGNIRADPTIWNDNQAKDKGGYTSIAKMMSLEGVHLRKAPVKGQEADVIAAERLLEYYWADPSDPTFQIFGHCHQTIRQFQKLKYREYTALTQEDHALREELVDKDNDTFDAWKYAECPMVGPEKSNRKAPPGSFISARNLALAATRQRPGRARAPVASKSHLTIS